MLVLFTLVCYVHSPSPILDSLALLFIGFHINIVWVRDFVCGSSKVNKSTLSRAQVHSLHSVPLIMHNFAIFVHSWSSSLHCYPISSQRLHMLLYVMMLDVLIPICLWIGVYQVYLYSLAKHLFLPNIISWEIY